MKRILLTFLVAAATLAGSARTSPVFLASPTGRLNLVVDTDSAGTAFYALNIDGKTILEPSPLGIVTSVEDFSRGLKLESVQHTDISESINLNRCKQSNADYTACTMVATYSNPKGQKINMEFRLSDDGLGYRYLIPRNDGERVVCNVERELSGFKFPEQTTTFLCPQAVPGSGWKNSKPSYEEDYKADAPVGEKSSLGYGFTFPCLFHVGDNGWALVSETGVGSNYCGSKLSDPDAKGVYSISFADAAENNGIGSANPSITLPGATPWRTVAVGSNLAPIVENVLQQQLVEPQFEAGADYKFGRGVWSWIMWQDNSINFDDQIQYIDLAAALGYEFALIDADWDRKIGRERTKELIDYAAEKGVGILLWYNSNGLWNNTVYSPVNIMSNSIKRKQEMKWLKDMGVKGIKVDFFGGDKQATMELYEQILSDANDQGILVIFHGCTIPRGWERMYPNYVGSEAVLASENLMFQQRYNDEQAFNTCLHPFIRNSIGCMEYGPVLLNKRRNRENNGSHTRRVSELFEAATSVIFQNPVQITGIAPNNLSDATPEVIEFLKGVPSTWDETRFIDGYPGKYVVLARRKADHWYIAAVSAEKKPLKLTLDLPMLEGKNATMLLDAPKGKLVKQAPKLKKGKLTLTLQPESAAIIY